jgi:hypothetical protein
MAAHQSPLLWEYGAGQGRRRRHFHRARRPSCRYEEPWTESSGRRGETHLVPIMATDNPADIGPVDIVLFCVKLWDVESAGQQVGIFYAHDIRRVLR